MTRRAAALLVSLVFFCPTPRANAAPTDSTRREIDRLLAYVAASRCEFERNGVWYDAQRALAHLKTKYEFLSGSIGSTEEFIDKAADRSSMSGQPYHVQCGSGPSMPSRWWLRLELARLRGAPGPASPVPQR